jgi:hypothetical protein
VNKYNSNRIRMMEDNIQSSRVKYHKGHITREQLDNLERDAKNRIKEIEGEDRYEKQRNKTL